MRSKPMLAVDGAGPVAGLTLALCLGPSTALAQAVFNEDVLRDGVFARDRNVSVRERPRPQYASPPYRVGTFLVSPQVAAGLELNDNVFADDLNEDDDLIIRIQPGVVARSNWSRNAVEGFARSTVTRFSDQSDENTTDYALGAVGRYDIARGTAIQAGASHEYVTEPRTASESPENLGEPIQFGVNRAFVGAVHSLNRLRLSGQVNVRELEFDNSVTVTGAPLVQSNRDRRIWTVSGRAEYAFSPAVSVFTSAALDRRSAQNQLPGDPDRDSEGAELAVGSNFDLGGLARGDVRVGYLSQDYEDPSLEDPSSLGFRARVDYFPTQLTTLRFTAERSIEESVRLATGGFVSATYSAQVDHELYRNVILTANLLYNRDDYEGLDRVNSRVVGTLSANYLLNRAVGVSIAAQRYDQESSGSQPGREFLVNRLVATLIYQFGVN